MRYFFAKSLIVNQIGLFRLFPPFSLFQRIRLLDFSALILTLGMMRNMFSSQISSIPEEGLDQLTVVDLNLNENQVVRILSFQNYQTNQKHDISLVETCTIVQLGMHSVKEKSGDNLPVYSPPA